MLAHTGASTGTIAVSERTSSDICRHFLNLIELLWTISLFSPPILLLCIVTKIFLHIYYGIQVKLDFSLQLSSSDPSPQSSLPSQRWRSSTQASLLHFTIPAEQFPPGTGADDQEKIKNYHLWISLLESIDCKTQKAGTNGIFWGAYREEHSLETPAGLWPHLLFVPLTAASEDGFEKLRESGPERWGLPSRHEHWRPQDAKQQPLHHLDRGQMPTRA